MLADPLLVAGEVVVLPVLGRDHLRSQQWDVPALVAFIEKLGPDVLIVDATPEEVAACGSAATAEHGADGLSALLVAPSPEMVAIAERRPELLTVVALTRWLGIELVPSGVFDDESRAQREAWFTANPFGPGSRDYMAARAAWQAAWLGRDAVNDLPFLFGSTYAELSGEASRWLSYHAEQQLGKAGELRGLAREAALVEDALLAYPDARVVVLTSHERRYFIEAAIAATFSDRILSAVQFLP